MSQAERRIPNTTLPRKSSIRREPDFVVDDFDAEPKTMPDVPLTLRQLVAQGAQCPTDPRTQLGRAHHWFAVSARRLARRIDASRAEWDLHVAEHPPFVAGARAEACTYCAAVRS